ncbi:uncharacterized protein EV422DRAFT_504931 [Fimicolochytrium jonesii]|uniref:uncharacterized protein n=1 Tax=Fimicolochytrium jonesii TaxID=1396493 RepID=UPI0022FEEE0A|nr:uncharacterized protein EV422DRAFT_504931 [Fimicolochytrium jonesii]KAI8822855.1 hypothetical protein EV422DRAFT_504931 [Fimicolochytrium jonesii]
MPSVASSSSLGGGRRNSNGRSSNNPRDSSPDAAFRRFLTDLESYDRIFGSHSRNGANNNTTAASRTGNNSRPTSTTADPGTAAGGSARPSAGAFPHSSSSASSVAWGPPAYSSLLEYVSAPNDFLSYNRRWWGTTSPNRNPAASSSRSPLDAQQQQQRQEPLTPRRANWRSWLVDGSFDAAANSHDGAGLNDEEGSMRDEASIVVRRVSLPSDENLREWARASDHHSEEDEDSSHDPERLRQRREAGLDDVDDAEEEEEMEGFEDSESDSESDEDDGQIEDDIESIDDPAENDDGGAADDALENVLNAGDSDEEDPMDIDLAGVLTSEFSMPGPSSVLAQGVQPISSTRAAISSYLHGFTSSPSASHAFYTPTPHSNRARRNIRRYLPHRRRGLFSRSTRRRSHAHAHRSRSNRWTLDESLIDVLAQTTFPSFPSFMNYARHFRPFPSDLAGRNQYDLRRRRQRGRADAFRRLSLAERAGVMSLPRNRLLTYSSPPAASAHADDEDGDSNLAPTSSLSRTFSIHRRPPPPPPMRASPHIYAPLLPRPNRHRHLRADATGSGQAGMGGAEDDEDNPSTMVQRMMDELDKMLSERLDANGELKLSSSSSDSAPSNTTGLESSQPTMIPALSPSTTPGLRVASVGDPINGYPPPPGASSSSSTTAPAAPPTGRRRLSPWRHCWDILGHLDAVAVSRDGDPAAVTDTDSESSGSSSSDDDDKGDDGGDRSGEEEEVCSCVDEEEEEAGGGGTGRESGRGPGDAGWEATRATETGASSSSMHAHVHGGRRRKTRRRRIWRAGEACR